jgi:pimeloyl-ACP methyl ester carboxylesterase
VSRRRRLLVGLGLLVAAALAVVVALAAAGDEEPRRFTVGEGTRAALVLRGTGEEEGRPVVVFLHGWTAIDPRAYDGWVRHLAARGADVVLPVYQAAPFLDVRTPLPNVIAALRAAFARLPDHGPVVAAGHSAGGALSADWAASAGGAGLPRPAAVYAVYPGRGLGGALLLRGPSLGLIDPSTRILALASPRDAVVGTATAEAMVREPVQIPAARRTLRIIREPIVQDHNAPLRTDPAARRTFWRPLDELVAQASGSRPSQDPEAP